MSSEQYIFEVKQWQLEKLDSFTKDPLSLEKTLGTRLDAQTDDDRLILAARVLFGDRVCETVDMLHEGQPGFLYASVRRQLQTRIPKKSSHHPEPDDSIMPPPNVSHPSFTTAVHGEQQQPSQ